MATKPTIKQTVKNSKAEINNSSLPSFTPKPAITTAAKPNQKAK